MKSNPLQQAANQYERNQYAMYLRKSRADLELESLGEEETLTRHKNMLMTLAAKYDIHPDQITIYHEMVSGDSIDERPEMQRLLSDVYMKKYKGVLVVEVERLARGNTKDQGEVADAFQASSTNIITPMKIYDPNNEFDQEYFEFGLFMSRREYKTIKRRLESGKKESVIEGNYVPADPPYGYICKRITKKERTLIEKPEEAKIVQMIFDWYTEDRQSQGWIARKLTSMGIPTRKNRPEWSKGTVRDMLSNVHYIGKVFWNDQVTAKIFDEEKGKLVKKRIPGEKEIYEGKHKGIISVEQFEKAQAITAASKPPIKKDVKLRSPLAGLLKCCDCGAHMTLMHYQSCPSNRYSTIDRITHPRREKCKKKSLPMSQVMDALVEALKQYIDDFTIKLENGSEQTELNRHYEAIKVMEAELKKQESKKKRLFDSWEADDGTYTRDEFIERKQMYTQTIDKLKEQIQEAKAAAPEPVDYSEKIVELHKVIECINNPDLDPKAKNDFLKTFIDYIDYDAIDYGQRKGGKVILDVHLK